MQLFLSTPFLLDVLLKNPWLRIRERNGICEGRKKVAGVGA